MNDSAPKKKKKRQPRKKTAKKSAAAAKPTKMKKNIYRGILEKLADSNPSAQDLPARISRLEARNELGR